MPKELVVKASSITKVRQRDKAPSADAERVVVAHKLDCCIFQCAELMVRKVGSMLSQRQDFKLDHDAFCPIQPKIRG